MAIGRIKGITIELNADTSKATKALSQFEKASRKVATSLRDINRVLKINPTSTEALTQKQEALRLQVQKTKEQLEMEKEALRQLEAGPQTEETVEQQKRLKLQIEETTGRLREQERQWKSFGSVAIQQMAVVGKSMQEMGEKMAAVGRNMSRYLTLPIVGMGTLAVKELGEFENAMAGVGAVSQASEEDLSAMSEYARNLAATTKFTAGEVTQAYHYMALAGWEPTEMMEGLEGVLNLVAASGEDLGTVSDIVTDSLTAMGEAADQSGRFADVLAIAMSHSNTNVAQLGEAFKYVAPVAGAMEYNIEDLAVALGTMANAGIKGSTAGTSLRTILTNMANPTTKMASAMEEIGVSLYDSEGNMYSMMEVMNQLRSGLGGLADNFLATNLEAQEYTRQLEEGEITEDEYADAIQGLIAAEYGAEAAHKAQLAAMLAGKRGMAGLLAVVNTSEEEWNGLAESIYNSGGAAEEMRHTMEDTLVGQITILKSQLAELAMQFGEALMPTIRSLVDWLQGVVKGFQELSPETKQMIVRIGAIVAAIGPLLFIGGKLLAGLGILLQMPAKLVAGIAGLISKLKILGVALSGPMGIIVAIAAAIGVLIAAFVSLWKRSETFRAAITAAFQQIQDAWGRLFEKLNFDVGALLQAFQTAWAWFTNNLAPIFIAAFQGIADFFSGVVDTILGLEDFFIGVFTGDWELAWEGVKGIFTGIWNAITGVFKAVWTVIVNLVMTYLKLMRTVITTVMNAVKTWITNRLTTIKAVFSSIWQSITSVVGSKIRAMRDVIKDVLNAVRTWISDKLTAIKTKFSNTWESIRNTASSAFERIKSAITSPIERAKEILDGIISRIKGLFPLSIGRIFSNLQLPHISVDAGQAPWGIGGKGRKPSFSVDWYAKAMKNGMILDGATIFGYQNGQFLGGGEKGKEAIIGYNSLRTMIETAARQNTLSPEQIYQAVRQGASDATIKNYINGREMTKSVNSDMTRATMNTARFQGA